MTAERQTDTETRQLVELKKRVKGLRSLFDELEGIVLGVINGSDSNGGLSEVYASIEKSCDLLSLHGDKVLIKQKALNELARLKSLPENAGKSNEELAKRRIQELYKEKIDSEKREEGLNMDEMELESEN